jgi:hypothetical protein
VRTLLDLPGATLLMLPRLLIDDRFRSHVVAHASVSVPKGVSLMSHQRE